MCEIVRKAIERLKQGLSAYEKLKNQPEEKETILVPNIIDDAAFYDEAVQCGFEISHFIRDKKFDNDLQRERYILDLSRKLQEYRDYNNFMTENRCV
ncbi:MAG: hypothetical protein LBH47_02925 [Christensenellaceae bacterium]|jgi:hypothetical protein|nr:hypothetical protein [Christensenellaceae bacterium]